MKRMLNVLLATTVLVLMPAGVAAAAPQRVPVPIGPAPYAGDQHVAVFTANNVNVHELPSTRGRLKARAQMNRHVGVHCQTVGDVQAGATNRTW